MKLRTIAAGLLALALSGGTAAAQSAKSLKEQIVGTWNFVVSQPRTIQVAGRIEF